MRNVQLQPGTVMLGNTSCRLYDDGIPKRRDEAVEIAGWALHDHLLGHGNYERASRLEQKSLVRDPTELLELGERNGDSGESGASAEDGQQGSVGDRQQEV